MKLVRILAVTFIASAAATSHVAWANHVPEHEAEQFYADLEKVRAATLFSPYYRLQGDCPTGNTCQVQVMSGAMTVQHIDGGDEIRARICFTEKHWWGWGDHECKISPVSTQHAASRHSSWFNCNGNGTYKFRSEHWHEGEWFYTHDGFEFDCHLQKIINELKQQSG